MKKRIWLTADITSPYLEIDFDKIRLYELDKRYYGEDVEFDPAEQAIRMIILQCEPDENGVYSFGSVRTSLSLPSINVSELYTQEFKDKAASWLPGCTPR